MDIQQLYYYYKLNQILIDNTLQQGKMNRNNDSSFSYELQMKLNLYNKYRDRIMKQIEDKLDEEFSE